MSFDKKAHVFEWIKRLWVHETRKTELFIPFSLPVSLDIHNAKNLLNRDMEYLVSEKSDGFRCMVLFAFYTEDDEDVPFIAFIDRDYKIEWHSMRNSDSSLFDGTLLDCERIEHEFIILDTIAINGYVKYNKHFYEREMSAKNYMEEIRFVVPYNIHMKQWVPVNKIDTLTPKYKNDGFVFIPSSLPVIQNRNKQMYKYKKTHTIDFYIDEHDNMYGSSDGKLVLFDNFVPTENDTNLHSGVYECELVETRSNKFIFKRVIQRLDKKCGNDVDTINSTIKAITINKISYQDLVNICTT